LQLPGKFLGEIIVFITLRIIMAGCRWHIVTARREVHWTLTAALHSDNITSDRALTWRQSSSAALDHFLQSRCFVLVY